MSNARKRSDFAIYRKLLLEAKPFWPNIAGLFTLSVLSTPLALLYSPPQTVSKSASSLQGSLVSAERAFALLDEAPEVIEKSSARPLKRAGGHVACENVTFGYNPERPALRNISLKISSGARVEIAGTTGAGKSTLDICDVRLQLEHGELVLLTHASNTQITRDIA